LDGGRWCQGLSAIMGHLRGPPQGPEVCLRPVGRHPDVLRHREDRVVGKLQGNVVPSGKGPLKIYVTLLEGVRCGTVSPNATRGEGVSQSVTCHLFQNFEPYFCILACFFKGKRLGFLYSKCHVTPGVGGGIRASVTKFHMGRRGV